MIYPDRPDLPSIARTEQRRRHAAAADAIKAGRMTPQAAAEDTAIWQAICAVLDGDVPDALIDHWPRACAATRKTARKAMQIYLAAQHDLKAGDRALALCRLAGSIAVRAETHGHTGMVDAYLDALNLVETAKQEEREPA